jgi:hypothetical protein
VEARLYGLIRDFQTTTASTLLAFLARAGRVHPFDWRAAALPTAGELLGDPPMRSECDRIGLRLEVGSEVVNFDFAFGDRTGGSTCLVSAGFRPADPFPEALRRLSCL